VEYPEAASTLPNPAIMKTLYQLRWKVRLAPRLIVLAGQLKCCHPKLCL
jgi:hypothetical protein